MTAFAANSLLCRAALATNEIDPASFTSIRLISGAVILGAIVYSRSPRPSFQFQRVTPSVMLFIYAAAFSFAYISLNAATGALILFGSVQATMMGYTFFSGERPTLFQLAGYSMAIVGMIYLISPGVTAPPLLESLLMSSAGIAWGIYTLLGKTASDPLIDTGNNFIKTLPLALIIGAFGVQQVFTLYGVGLAITSGALTSGLGYAIWYTAIKGLSPTQAASVQLSVPIITAIGGIVLLSEELSLRLAIATILILGGIACTLMTTSNNNEEVSQ